MLAFSSKHAASHYIDDMSTFLEFQYILLQKQRAVYVHSSATPLTDMLAKFTAELHLPVTIGSLHLRLVILLPVHAHHLGPHPAAPLCRCAPPSALGRSIALTSGIFRKKLKVPFSICMKTRSRTVISMTCRSPPCSWTWSPKPRSVSSCPPPAPAFSNWTTSLTTSSVPLILTLVMAKFTWGPPASQIQHLLIAMITTSSG
mmetsp:Transcript_27448/g.72874  ORF Transcript_27448/g.72874 Transcript_27448/m.72874 type:complete len:202 (-) Transcript_27448:676-1281(-)